MVDAVRKRLIVAGKTGTLSRVSLPDLVIDQMLENAHEGEMDSLAISPNGRLLATGGSDRRIVLRDPATFKPLFTFPLWAATVKELAFSATGRWLAIAGADSDVGLWDLGLIRDELAALGLAWDQAVPAVDPTANQAVVHGLPKPQVPIINLKKSHPVGFERARAAVRSGIPTPALGKPNASRVDDPAESFKRGGLLARRGAWRDALAEFREGLARDSSDTIPWMRAATLYLQLGDVEGYRRHARNA